MLRLRRSFYSRYTPEVAKGLLGCVIVRSLGDTIFKARIVETEAYRGQDDPASHAYRGLTKRTEVMFGTTGHSYVYFTYGNHFMLNLTTEAERVPGAVLIRAAEPLQGIEEMKRRRGVEKITDLMSGPGKLTKAIGIDKALNGEDVVNSKRLYILAGISPQEVGISTRIGVNVGAEIPWRFFEKGSPFVSGSRMHNYGARVAG